MRTFLASSALVLIGFAAGIAWFYWGSGVPPVSAPSAGSVERSEWDLPRLPEPFAGRIARSELRSRAAFPDPVRAPSGAPNVVLILTDDVGFGASSTFGGPIPTPALDALAENGLVYNRFHTTAMCSPTRAALLTGRNAHRVGNGLVSNLATGYPGYNGEIPRSAATIGRILTGNGYNTAFFGKHHNVPEWHSSAAGPFDLWPTGLGFEYFYGFLNGDTDQFRPVLYQGVTRVTETPADDFVLDRGLVDRAVRWLHDQQAAAPDKPFFVYLAPGTAHAPHQAPKRWIDAFDRQFTEGWDHVRAATHRRQLTQGIVPAGTKLTPRPEDLPPWDSLSPAAQQMHARFMQVFAATLAHQDQQMGRLFNEIRRMGRMDNTLVFFIQGDNGGSAEGGVDGTLNEIGTLANGLNESVENMHAWLERMGGPETYQTYSAAWAWATHAPFQWTKTIASHLGGTRNGLVVSWPRRIRNQGIRSQFHHVVDVVPTILAAAGIGPPATVDGIPQLSLDGVDMSYAWDLPDAPEARQTQYFELMGHRAIYHDGWMASTTPKLPPWSQSSPAPGEPQWELYHLETDFSQSNNVAADFPQRLEELKALWWQEAQRNGVLPVDERRGALRAIPRLLRGTPRTEYRYFAGTSVYPEQAPSLMAKDFSVVATFTEPVGHDTSGVVMELGSYFGGWGFYLDEGTPVVRHAASQYDEDRFEIFAERPLAPGERELIFDFDYRGWGIRGPGNLAIHAGRERIGFGRIGKTAALPAGLGELLDIGGSTGVPVHERQGPDTLPLGHVTIRLD